LVDLIEFELFCDYNCPFVYRAAEMLESVRESRERQVEVAWRYFSLSQVAPQPLNGDAVRILDEIVAIAAREPAILEIKRPVKPTL
jgi:predicted DsbA family dithiol-disulfide isomerase